MDPTQTNNDIRRFLEHVDDVLEEAKGIYDLGEHCRVHFNVCNYYEIPESERKFIESELRMRDSGTPEIKWMNGFLYDVKINNPWG